MLGNILPLVLHALGNPDLSISSVSTLKKICRECKSDLPPYANNIVAASQVMYTCAGFCCYTLLLAFNLSASSVTANSGRCQLDFPHLTFEVGNFGAFYTNRPIDLTWFFFPALKEVLIKQIHKVSRISPILSVCFSCMCW